MATNRVHLKTMVPMRDAPDIRVVVRENGNGYMVRWTQQRRNKPEDVPPENYVDLPPGNRGIYYYSKLEAAIERAGYLIAEMSEPSDRYPYGHPAKEHDLKRFD